MKILHLHKNAIPYLNDDEGSIAFSLRKLGHEVVNSRESNWQQHRKGNFDFTLFHHWAAAVNNAPKLPGKKVCWYFDLVDFRLHTPYDKDIIKRRASRPTFMLALSRVCDLVCHTDGDWSGEKSYVLQQGADPRIVGKYLKHNKQSDIVYVGGNTGVGRKHFVHWLSHTYGTRMTRIWRSFSTQLARELGTYKIAVAPDVPVSDRYWSNRVYVLTGFGVFLLHPYCAELAKQYEDKKEIVFYRDREELQHYVDYYLRNPDEREKIALAGMYRTTEDHTYLNRCKELIEQVERIL